MSKSEHITQFLVVGFYYWFIDREDIAKMCWQTGVEVIDMLVGVVGEA